MVSLCVRSFLAYCLSIFKNSLYIRNVVFVVQSISHVQLFVTTWITAHQAPLSSTNSWSLPSFLSVESVMLSDHLILCHPLVLLPWNLSQHQGLFQWKTTDHIRWLKYWSFSFSISPSNEYSGLISFRMDCLISLQSQGLSKVFCSTTFQKHQFFGSQPYLWSNFHVRTWLSEKL